MRGFNLAVLTGYWVFGLVRKPSMSFACGHYVGVRLYFLCLSFYDFGTFTRLYFRVHDGWLSGSRFFNCGNLDEDALRNVELISKSFNNYLQ